ncbi:MAG: SurA N-terminal domain-containing protein [Desulfobacterales bacterium]|nr:SurA N-terminal domain-containing protein [Desulfobacterales bacterium]
MLRYLRENTGNWIIKIFLGIIVIVFVFLGVGSMNATKNNEVAVVNDQPITFGEYQDAYKNLIKRMQQQFGNALNDDLVKALNIKQQAINSLIDQKIMDMEADKLKILVSDSELQDALLSIKAFQRNGAFDMDLYKRVLGQNGLNPETFEALQRRAIKNAKLQEMVLNGITVTDEEAKTWYTFNNTKMAIDYIKVDPGTFTNVKPTEEEVNSKYKDNPDLYKSEPKRKALYIVFSPEDHKDEAAVTDEQALEYYEQNTARFTTAEQVEASHILIRVDADADEQTTAKAKEEADAVYEKAAKGEDFAQLAKTYSQGPTGPNGGYLGRFEKSSMVKPFGDAAFAMKAGEVSKPVKTQFGWHVIKVTDKTPETVKSFEDAKVEIQDDLAAQELQNLAYYKAGEAFDSVIDGDDFEQVALIAKKKVIETPVFTELGDGLSDLDNPAQFASAAFELINDEISEVKQIGDKYYLIKIVEKIEPVLLPFEDVQAQIVETLTAKLQKDAAQKAAKAMIEKADAKSSIQDIAKANNLEVASSTLFTRNQAVPGIPGSRDISAKAFSLTKETPVYTDVLEAGTLFYLIGFKEKQVPEAAVAEENQEQVKQEITSRKQQEYYAAWMQSLKEKADIKINSEIIN